MKQSAEIRTVANLMDEYSKLWNEKTKKFDFPEGYFNLEAFQEHLSAHAEKFSKAKMDVFTGKYFGYIEKFDLELAENPQIFVRADLHGDLKSLFENIRALQNQGLLDADFRCKPGVHLVFLGDYSDRGQYSTQVLEMLMRLREENLMQVHLLRGNHEEISLHVSPAYKESNPNLQQVIISNPEGQLALRNFYATMPLTTYFSVHQEGRREYVQFTHALFEPTMDPSPLLDRASSGAHLLVPTERKLSERVCNLAQDDSSPLQKAAQRISALAEMQRADARTLYGPLTVYNWGDVSDNGETKVDRPLGEPDKAGKRQYYWSVEDIRNYLDLSSEKHRVDMIFRGHQHKFQHFKHKDKVLVTTLPVGMDGPYGGAFGGQLDRSCILTLKPQVEDWTKRSLLRESGSSLTMVTEELSVTDSAI